MTDQATIIVNIIDGGRQPLPAKSEILIYVRDRSGKDVVAPFWIRGTQRAKVRAPFHDNGDVCALVATAKGYRQAGTFVRLDPNVDRSVTLVLVDEHAQCRFQSWLDLKQQQPHVCKFLACDGNEAAAQVHYEALVANKPAVLASLLNLICAMSAIQLGDKTPLDYFKRIFWDDSMAQDRFFGMADARIVDAVKAAADKGEFAEEPDCGKYHAGATCSYKQIQYDVANVQLTFHENDAEVIDDVKCVKVEPDIDYYKDLIAHGLGEVLPNLLTHGLTNPETVYCLRCNAEGSAFNPGYSLCCEAYSILEKS